MKLMRGRRRRRRARRRRRLWLRLLLHARGRAGGRAEIVAGARARSMRGAAIGPPIRNVAQQLARALVRLRRLSLAYVRTRARARAPLKRWRCVKSDEASAHEAWPLRFAAAARRQACTRGVDGVVGVDGDGEAMALSVRVTATVRRTTASGRRQSFVRGERARARLCALTRGGGDGSRHGWRDKRVHAHMPSRARV